MAYLHVETGLQATIVLINTGAARSDSMIETSAGDITVYLASDVAISVRASVDLGNGHRITSELGSTFMSTAKAISGGRER